jgi:hypothetical protein
MALIVYPCKAKKFFGTIEGFDEEIYGFFVKVFESNSSSSREMLFSNTLVQRVWNRVVK